MTYLLLVRPADEQETIPRPFNRAANQTEALQILEDWGKAHGEKVFIHAGHLESNLPFAYIGGDEFFLFVEPF